MLRYPQRAPTHHFGGVITDRLKLVEVWKASSRHARNYGLIASVCYRKKPEHAHKEKCEAVCRDGCFTRACLILGHVPPSLFPHLRRLPYASMTHNN